MAHLGSSCRGRGQGEGRLHIRGTVHIVDDDAARRESLAGLIEKAGYRVHAYASTDELLATGTPAEAGCDLGDA
jgi:FixJ family two-component response regulator